MKEWSAVTSLGPLSYVGFNLQKIIKKSESLFIAAQNNAIRNW